MILKIILKFLLADSGTFEQLSRNRFTTHWMLPFQIIRALIRASNRLIVVLDPQASPPVDDSVDKWIAILNSAYPFTPLMNITIALCWGHILEKFFEHGTYNFASSRDEQAVPLDRTSSENRADDEAEHSNRTSKQPLSSRPFHCGTLPSVLHRGRTRPNQEMDRPDENCNETGPRNRTPSANH